MSRSTALTVCVVTGDDRRVTRQFLARLAGCLGQHDNVLLTGTRTPPATDPGAWRALARGELRRGSGETTPGARPVVIFVDDRVEAPDGWLDILADALAVPGVAAVAPRCNAADGDELYVGVPYRPEETGLRRRFARDLVEGARGRVTDASMLLGPCIAVRRETLEDAGGLAAVLEGGFDPAGISAIASRSGRLAVAEACFLHHPGGAPRWPDPREVGLPLVSACLIVRDEEKNLSHCLASMAGLADEIVVYDTGSVDGTVRIAEQAGATVVRGYWDDDFARARNDALDACRGQWILWLDADEELVCQDPAAVRTSLRALPTEVEGFVVLIDNLKGNEAASVFTHSAGRLFRRACGHWEGHLHELVVARAGRPDMSRQQCEMLRIAHRGYLQSHIASRGKGERNLRTAFGDLAGGSELPWSIRLLSLGRSYVVAGRIPEGLEHCRNAAEIAEAPATRRLALRTSTECLLALGRPEEALEEITLLRSISSNPVMADAYEGRARLALGEHEAAIEAFDKVRHTVDEDGWEHTPADVAAGRAEALGALGRHGEAADTLLACLDSSGGLDAHLGLAIEAIESAGRDVGEVYEVLGAERIRPFVPQLLQLQRDVADRALESWYRLDQGSRLVLAAAAQVAPGLEISRQLVWSARLREAGFSASCPLVASAADEAVAPRDRVLAAAAAVAVFSDVRARQAFGAAVLSMPPSLRATLAEEGSAIAPQLAHVFEGLDPSVLPRERLDRGEAARARRVLLVDREANTLRTSALAAVLAGAGHEVALLRPLPATSSTKLLGPSGVVVHGWHHEEPEETSWRASCARALAWCTAEQPFDVAVVSKPAVDVIADIRRLLPLAAIVVDLDSSRDALVGPGSTDLLLSSLGEPPFSGVVTARATAGHVLPPRPPVPLGARAGLVIAGDLRCMAPAAIEHLTGTIAPLLRSACGTSAIALCGDDPGRILASALPDAIDSRGSADPSPWIASARVLLVAHSAGAEHWLAAAQLYGTPALVVPDDGARAGEVVAAVAALLADDALWQHFAPQVPLATTGGADALVALAAPVRKRRPPGHAASARPEVRIVGGVYGRDSLSQVNRELAVKLARDVAFDLTVLTGESEPPPRDSVHALAGVHVLRSVPSRPAALEIRHQWPPDFTPVRSGRLVCIQPWEFGGLPAEWIAPLRDVVDELWVPTSWVRDCAVRSGVAEEKVHVVPNGIDVERFRPEGRPYPLRTRKGTKLLFVGGLIERKGVDALLEAYLSTFTADDDVCLVIKPFGSHSVYSNSTLEREVRQAASAAGAEIEMVDGDLDFDDMAALYRSCDALVHPYRGEGFGLPIAEAMASGLAVVVTHGGACLDFCDEDNAWLVGAREVPILPGGWTPSVPGNWWLEPSRRELSAAMRAVLEDPEIAEQKGLAGRRRIAEHFTWDVAATRATERIGALLELDLAREEPDEPIRAMALLGNGSR